MSGTTTPTGARCRHRSTTWVFRPAGQHVAQYLLWCYACGAIRVIPDDKRWTKPVGIGGENPAMKGEGKAR